LVLAFGDWSQTLLFTMPGRFTQTFCKLALREPAPGKYLASRFIRRKAGLAGDLLDCRFERPEPGQTRGE
jgi:hypothetical protein